MTLTLKKLLVELGLECTHCHMLSVGSTVCVVKRRSAVKQVLAAWMIPQADAAGLPHEGAHICCTFHLQEHQ